MEIAKTIANSLKEVLLSGKWVSGTNIKDEIIDLDWKTATIKIDSLNSIADLIFHIDYYLSGVLNVLNGGDLEIRDKYSFDYKQIESQEDWKKLIDKFCDDAQKFVDAVEKMTNKDLEKIFVKEQYGSYFRNLTVMSEHSYYHLGQITLIKKLIKQRVLK
jgi:uncharacterized damage-inducible protein DinB